MSRCDKCGEKVAKNNSAIRLEYKAYGEPVPFWFQDRHLYPTDYCPGSPSRVKLVETDEQWASAYEEIQST